MTRSNDHSAALTDPVAQRVLGLGQSLGMSNVPSGDAAAMNAPAPGGKQASEVLALARATGMKNVPPT